MMITKVLCKTLIIACSISSSITSLAQDNPEDSRYSPQSPSKIEEPLRFTIDSGFDDPNEVKTVELGDIVCGSQLRVEITVRNTSDVATELPRRTSSCGCMTGLPETLAVPAKGETVLPLKIDVTKKPEEVFQNVAYWNSSGEPRLQLQLRFQAVLPFTFDKKTISIESEGIQSYDLALKALDSTLETKSIKMEAYAPELASYEYSVQNKRLHLKIDPSKSVPNATTSTLQLVITNAEGIEYRCEVSIQYRNRTKVVPSVLRLNAVDDLFQGEVTVFSEQLRVEQKGRQIEAFLTKNGEPSKVKVQVKLGDFKESSIALRIYVSIDRRQLQNPPDVLELRCGSWKVSVPVELP